MSTLSADIPTSFTALTGSGTQDTIRTGTTTESVTVHFRNYGVASATLKMFVNGTTAIYQAFGTSSGITLDVGESGSWFVDIGSGDVLYAEASAATTIAYMVELDMLA